jgi:hypothetical protein
MKCPADLTSYVRSKLQKGEFIEKPSPRSAPADRFLELRDHHAQEQERASAACELSASSEKLVISAINPYRNHLAVLEIEPPQQELNWSVKTGSEVRKLNESDARSVKDKAAIDLHVVEKLNNGSIKTFDDLVALCGSMEAVTKSLKRIKRFSAKPLSIQTLHGVVDFDPGKLLQSRVPDSRVEHCRVRYLGEHRKGADVLACLRVFRHGEAGGLPTLASDGSYVTRLETTNNLRSLKILQGLCFLDLEVEVMLGAAYDLSAQKWQLTLRSLIDETSILPVLGPLGAFLPD